MSRNQAQYCRLIYLPTVSRFYKIFNFKQLFFFFSVKFGLYEVDFINPNRTRVPRKSAFVYKEIIKTKKLDLYYDLNITLNKY